MSLTIMFLLILMPLGLLAASATTTISTTYHPTIHCPANQSGSQDCPCLSRTTSLNSTYSVCYPSGACHDGVCRPTTCQACQNTLTECLHQYHPDPKTEARYCACLNRAQACFQLSGCPMSQLDKVQEDCSLIPGCMCQSHQLARCQQCYQGFQTCELDNKNDSNDSNNTMDATCHCLQELIDCYWTQQCDPKSMYSYIWTHRDCHYLGCDCRLGNNSDTIPSSIPSPPAPSNSNSSGTAIAIVMGVLVVLAFLVFFIWKAVSITRNRKKDLYSTLLVDSKYDRTERAKLLDSDIDEDDDGVLHQIHTQQAVIDIPEIPDLPDELGLSHDP